MKLGDKVAVRLQKLGNFVIGTVVGYVEKAVQVRALDQTFRFTDKELLDWRMELQRNHEMFLTVEGANQHEEIHRQVGSVNNPNREFKPGFIVSSEGWMVEAEVYDSFEDAVIEVEGLVADGTKPEDIRVFQEIEVKIELVKSITVTRK